METKVRRFYFVKERFSSAIQYLFRFCSPVKNETQNLCLDRFKKRRFEGSLMFLQAVTVQISLQPCVAVSHLCNRAKSSRPVDDKIHRI